MAGAENMEFVERYDPVDSIESTHYERLKARGLANVEEDGEYTYSDVKLESLGRKWIRETENELRSPRSRYEAQVITDLIAFEIAYRTGELKRLEAMYHE